MTKARLEAFSDGVIAILITIMVLELKVPRGSDWAALDAILPEFLTYVLSFLFLGIYWSNHHHMLHLAGSIGGAILWANLHLLFWLSLVPVGTGWMGTHSSAPVPTAVYGGILLAAGVAYLILQGAIVARQGKDSKLKVAIGRDIKGKLSAALYVLAIVLAFYGPWISDLIYVSVAMMWLVPDRRIESNLEGEGGLPG